MAGRRESVCLLLGLLPGTLAAGTAQPVEDALFEELHRVLGVVRETAGLEPLGRSDALRRLAERRAGDIAAAPVGRRLPHPVPLDDAVDDTPELEERTVVERVTIVPAGVTGNDRLRGAWDSPVEDAPLLDTAMVEIGIGAWTAGDGALIVVALYATAGPEADRETLERVIVDEINDVRVEHGLRELKPNAALRAVARGHSETMADGDFMAHESPDGSMPADRIRAAGIGFRLSGENVARSRRALGAIHGVVEEWMESPGHRHNILTPDFRETAVGVAFSVDGTLYITQLFLEP
ncbi:MAG: hypothetical protein GTO30_11885 [Acidobacteria bacterium]|nr:hypothetical protein [Acidobacteriota bacterium]NIM62327.1 hypothetical protein [Acidobacteriota bacterium]NIO60660.1 hypothetical protein [Acidobacteriota bacterium]NIQ85093.1 hypothetical protein [Acidobacteriota bacterium]NIT12304.1 hypothetical protein [Acidobacteriota bacterium]